MAYLDVVPLRRVPWGLREFTYAAGDTGAQVGDLVWCRFGGHRTAAVVWSTRQLPPEGVRAQPIAEVARSPWTTAPQRAAFQAVSERYATPLPTLLYRYGLVPTSRAGAQSTAPSTQLPPTDPKLLGASLVEASPSDLPQATAQLVAQVAARGTALVLCPTRRDVAELAQLVGGLAYDLAESRTERARTWDRVMSGECRVVVGTAAAAFLPFAELGGVVVYHEGNPAAKAVEAKPLLHLLSLAKILGATYRCQVTVADFSPSPAAAAWARDAGRLVRRPPAERYSANVTLVSPPLLRSPKMAGEVRSAKPSSRLLLLVPRLGEGAMLRCADCGSTPACPSCERSLPLASAAQLRCGFCGYLEAVPARCSRCGGTRLQAKRPTVATVAREVRKLRGREDVGEVAAGSLVGSDETVVVSSAAALYQLNLESFALRVALDFDTLLRQPTLEAAPRAYRMVRELAASGPTVIETSLPEHPSLVQLDSWEKFVASQLAERRRFQLPPASPIAKLSLDAAGRDAMERAARSLSAHLSRVGADVVGSCQVPGRSPRRRYRWVTLVRGLEPPAGVDYSQWTIDPDPTDLD